MKKINELVTTSKKTENRAKKKAITFGSFKRAEEKQIQERKDREHQAELARIAEQARLTREIADEEERVIREESKRKRNEFITGSLKNAFGTKTNVDMNPVREEVIDKYIPQLKEPKKEERPTPFKAEPALNAELEEFKKKINEHLHTIGFASSSGGGAGSFADLDDVDPTTAKVDGKTIQFDSSTNKFVGADVTAGALAADNLTAGDAAVLLTTSSGDITIDAAANNSDIILKGTDGSSDTTFLTIDGSAAGKATFNNEIVSGAVITSGAGIVIANAGNIGSASDTDAISIASNGVVTFSQAPVFPDGSIAVADIDIDGGTDIGAGLADADLFIVDDAGGGTNRKTAASRIKTYVADVTLTTAAQTNITSLGTLTALTVDNIVINGTNIGHTSDTDAIAIASDGDVTLSQNLVVTGDFTVNGTTTTVSTTNMKVSDTLIELNTGAGSNANDMGLIMERGSTGDNAIFMFDESADEFTVGTTTATNDATGNISVTAGTFTAATLKGNLVVADDGNIGSASDTDAIAIASDGVVTFSQVPVFPNNTVESADIQADAVTGAKIADDAIDSEHYVDGSIDTAHIADNQITPAKIAGEVNAQTGTSYTLVLTDAFKTVTSSNGSAQTITIPPNSSVAFSVGDRIDIMMLGSGTTTVTGGSGVTLNGVSTGSGAISAQFAAVSCIKLATNTWVLMGNHGGVS